MRTIKRISLPVNKNKLRELASLVAAYNNEKNDWFIFLNKIENIHYIKQFRELRNKLVSENYKSPYGLPANHWKNALEDAVKSMDMYWQGIFVNVRPHIFKASLTDEQRRWCFSILKNYQGFAELRQFHYPKTKFLSDYEQIRKAGNFLNRMVSKYVGNYPTVKRMRSMMLTEIVYSIKGVEKKQVLSISSCVPRKLINIPLLGYTAIPKKVTAKGKSHFGTVRIVLNGEKVQLHYTSDIKQSKSRKSGKVAIDLGYSELFVDNMGNSYGDSFGRLSTEKSDSIDAKNKKRNKLRAIRKQALDNADFHKAHNILKFNLGKKKQEAYLTRVRATIENVTNYSINKLLSLNPEIVITENLNFAQVTQKGKKWNRRLSQWCKGVIIDRLAFKTLVGRSNHQQVNAAYTSQTCPRCGFVHKNNRNRDLFQCLDCGHRGHADHVAAMNILSRYDDKEIALYMSAKSVKSVLDERFHRQLETSKLEGTVSVRTPDSYFVTPSESEFTPHIMAVTTGNGKTHNILVREG